MSGPVPADPAIRQPAFGAPAPAARSITASDHAIDVLPVSAFARELWSGALLAA
jgi:hypothetical protein